MIERLYQIFQQCSSVTTDSRNCPQDSLFIALKGDVGTDILIRCLGINIVVEAGIFTPLLAHVFTKRRILHTSDSFFLKPYASTIDLM